jgi:hypothetical protein
MKTKTILNLTLCFGLLFAAAYAIKTRQTVSHHKSSTEINLAAGSAPKVIKKSRALWAYRGGGGGQRSGES